MYHVSWSHNYIYLNYQYISVCECVLLNICICIFYCDEHRAMVHSRGIGPFARRRL